MEKVKGIAKQNIVFVIAFAVALVTAFIIPPSGEYLGYFDYKTLACLYCVLAVVCALRNIKFFYILAQRIVKIFKTTRVCVLALVYITFVGSMLIANDMALLTFLPLGFFVLKSTGKEKYMAYTFILQNIAANLGGMLTPFGNPQNLYLYSKFEIPTLEFMQIMFPPFIVSIVLITICCLFIKNEPMELKGETEKLDVPKSFLYAALFVLAIVIVFRVVHYAVGIVIITAVLLFIDRKALKMVDYPLLLTFVCFFIFTGNISRIDAVQVFFSNLLEKSTLLVSVLSCQFISNVPTAVLLSGFTTNYQDLLVGVNIGGVGTLISSLASMITFREYVKYNPDGTRRYIIMFTVMNFAFLIILIAMQLLIKSLM